MQKYSALKKNTLELQMANNTAFK